MRKSRSFYKKKPFFLGEKTILSLRDTKGLTLKKKTLTI